MTHSGSGSSGALTRIFGGSPLGVILRLALLSVIVGVVLDQLHVDAFELFRWAVRSVEDVFENSADVLRTIARYFLLGAAVVIPIWIVLRLLKIGGGRR